MRSCNVGDDNEQATGQRAAYSEVVTTVRVADECAAVIVPLISAAGLVVGLCLVTGYDALCSAGWNFSNRGNGLSAF